MKFVIGKPALIHHKNLIIGDIHLGHLNNQTLDKLFSKKMAEEVNNLIEEYGCKRLIILGDVKEDITSVPSYVYDFFKDIKCKHIIIVKGNHDGEIEKVCQSFGCKVCPGGGCVIDKMGLFHGHSWPKKELLEQNYLIMSHLHQSIVIKDKFNKKHKIPVWIIGNATPSDNFSDNSSDRDVIKDVINKYTINPKLKLIIVPPFNPFLGFNVSYELLKISPVLKNNVFKLNSLYIYDLNGILLGKLSDFLEGDYG